MISFWPKFEFLGNRNFAQKSKFWPKLDILTKNRNFDQKIEILTKNLNFSQKSKFLPKIEIFWSKIDIVSKSRKIEILRPKIETILFKTKILVKNRYCVQRLKSCLKINIRKFWPNIENFGQKSKFWSKLKY